jgi:nonsense-mediated mRNA decay protein 3
LCCECGVEIDHNPLNTCLQCIQSKIDITEPITKQAILQFCNKCDRYLQPPNVWITASLESRQLLAICLKRIKGLNKVTLVDASFIWTEPHSKRIKVKIVVQKEISGAFLQQTAVCEFNVVNQICEDCQRAEAKDYWNAVVQVRQRVEHKKTFYFLEQVILKLNMHSNCVSIKQVHEGIDFYYANKESARKMIDFLEGIVAMRFTTSKRLISHDIHSNTYNYKYTFSVEIVPICKDNIVCLSKNLSRQLGGFGPICICTKVTKLIHLIDPQTLLMTEIDANTYWRTPFASLCTPKQLNEYIIMDIEQIDSHHKRHVFGKESKKHVLADAWVMKSKELTQNNQQHHTKTHLGHLLNYGDLALGFDFANANLNDPNLDDIKSDNIPDIVSLLI